MSDSIKKLIKKLQNDQEMANKFKACKSTAEQAKLANDLGFQVTAAEFEKLNQNLSDEQLDQVAGGSCFLNIAIG
ncbi:Nif11-like leader peptide family RiPP precursor [Anaerovorax odorimutans]|uniref:Nif11-like leader peptide family RiPP precursor n=1 Tax=Anaerovorax odorimutans TaxID=109327 RepID=UPI00040F5F17|nr:Nif11-like leader peptide family RiPP precursor [Anaerovorax odorimutans]